MRDDMSEYLVFVKPQGPANKLTDPGRVCSLELTAEEHCGLKTVLCPDPLVIDLLRDATPSPNGFCLTGTRLAFRELVGWVASEVNHLGRRSRSRKLSAREVLLHHIADQIDHLLRMPPA